MKTRLLIAMALFGAVSLAPFRAAAYHEVSASVEITAEAEFYEPLAAHGAWVEVESYGRCWRPAHVEIHWRPYCYGHWVWTDCGWYWVSDEPWAWACYHYGRWAYHPRHAWIWVPGTTWGPAWVCWREGGGYVGWAPLPPHARFHGDVIVDVHVEPSLFVFVDFHRFHHRVTPKTVIVNDTKIVNKTKNITKIKQVEKTIVKGGPKKVVINEGPQVQVIEKATGQKVQRASIQDVAERTPPPAAVKRKAPKRQDKELHKDQPAPQRQETTEPRLRDQPGPDEPKARPRREAQPSDEPASKPQRERPARERPRPEAQPDEQQPEDTPARPPRRSEDSERGQRPSDDEVRPSGEQAPAPEGPPEKSKKTRKDGKKKDKHEDHEQDSERGKDERPGNRSAD